MKLNPLVFLIFTFSAYSFAQEPEPFELSNEWISQIEQSAPSTTTIPIKGKKKILIFSLHTGFEHWTIPHTETVIKTIAEKSGAYSVTTSKDISMFEMKNLKNFDAIVLNNNCSIGDKRDLFWDVLKNDKALNDQQRMKKAKKLENNLLKYVKEGHGLMVLHGSIVM